MKARYRYGHYLTGAELITPSQCRAAQAITGLGFRELAQEAETSTKTLLLYIKHRKGVHPPIMERVRKVFEQRGVRFTLGKNAGVRFDSDAVGRPVQFDGHGWR